MLYEENALANRYTYATAKLDRGDKYPDALAVAGGDPRLAGVSGITAGETIPTDTRTTITYAQAQQAAFNIEGVPAYDNIFVIMEENKSTDAILGNTRAPYINQLLTQVQPADDVLLHRQPVRAELHRARRRRRLGHHRRQLVRLRRRRRQRAERRRLRGRHGLGRPAAAGHRHDPERELLPAARDGRLLLHRHAGRRHRHHKTVAYANST